jgi:NAD(P)-dependent dehydrogenase (short-subunit alcohol dehydrogenase family)
VTTLAGRHAVVTGGGRGIGRATARALTHAGAVVTVMGRTAETLIDAVDRGDATAYAVADVTDPDAISAAIKSAEDGTGPISILVANAGAAETAPFGKSSPDLFRRMFEVNTIGSIHAIQAALGGMIERGFGRVVAVASTSGLKGYAYASAYCAAKHAVVGLVRALAAETTRTGVTVNAVCPTYTDTDLIDVSLQRIVATTGRSREDALASILKGAPMGRLVKPEEVAAAVVFLCLPESAAITGTALPIAGGEI